MKWSENTHNKQHKRIHKDIYAEKFSEIRHFPALHPLALGDVANISILGGKDKEMTSNKPLTTTQKLIKSKYMETDMLHEILGETPSLSTFRAAVLCNHSKKNKKDTLVSKPSELDTKNSYHNTEKPVFKPFMNTASLKITDRKKSNESIKVPQMNPIPNKKDITEKKWNFTNSSGAKNNIQVHYYLNSPLEEENLRDKERTKILMQQNLEKYKKRQNDLQLKKK